MRNKIVFLLTKYNNPTYFPLWLENAGKNACVDFIVFSDQKEPENLPSNVRFVYFSFAEICELIQSKFDFKVNIPSPYKICDFRPAFGYIFSNYTSGYSFWGTIDLDIILGNVDHFVNDNLLDCCDRFLTRDHFSLYRNSEKVNNGFLIDQDLYKKVFTNKWIYCFGEMGKYGVYQIWKKQKWPIYEDNIIADININHHSFMVNSENDDFPRVFHRDSNGLNGYFNTNAEIHKKEYLYIHLQKRVMKYTDKCCERYFIIPNEFVPDTTKSEREFNDKIIAFLDCSESKRRINEIKYFPSIIRNKINAQKLKVKE